MGLNENTPKKTTYLPVVALFFTAALLALATSKGMMAFMGYALAILALQKLMDLGAFIKTFERYDLFTKAVPLYGKTYPWIELALGLGFLSGIAPLPTAVISVILGFAGGTSIFKAVYIDKKDLNCGCVGGNSKVPLGLLSLIESAVMAVMGIAILIFRSSS